jgi:deoxyribonuclease-4
VRIGFHMSIARGSEFLFQEMERLGCEALQVFVKNPRSWASRDWSTHSAAGFKELAGRYPVFAHLSYLPNLAKIDEDPKNLAGFLEEARICRHLGIGSLVVHCGSRKDRGKGMEMVAAAINCVLDEEDMEILLENGSGQGFTLGKNIDELSMIVEGVRRKEKVLLCLDTAHLFQSGHNIVLRRVWNGLIKDIQARFGKDSIGLFHLNDSKTALGSSVDRHWHIGKGTIGLRAFRFIVNDERFARLCGVMETPKTGKMDEENMKTIRSLLSPLVSRSSS